MKIIGIGGTDGSGKDTVAEMLANDYGWLYISVTDILREEAAKRGISYNRRHLREISAEWRRQFGMGVLVDKAMEVYNQKAENQPGLAIASLRNPAEPDEVHKLGGQVIWVDADPHVRYERIAGRQRGKEDEVSFVEFLTEEKAQMDHDGDDATLSLSKVKAKADIFVQNDGYDIKAFKKEVAKVLKSARLI